MKKALNILLIVLGIGGLVLIGITIFIGTSMGKRAENIEGIKSTEYPTRTELRNLIVYEFDSIKKKMPYELIIREKDSVLIYNYKNKTDSTKNMSFRYLKHNGNLFFGPDEFGISIKNEFQSDFKFDQYNLTEEVIDGMGVLLFNRTYGVLGFDNGWGKQFYYLTEQNINEIKLPILYRKTE